MNEHTYFIGGADMDVIYSRDKHGEPVEMARCSNSTVASYLIAIWNATNGMTTKQAVKYLEHGAEMVETLKAIELDVRRGMHMDYDGLVEVLAKLEGGNDEQA